MGYPCPICGQNVSRNSPPAALGVFGGLVGALLTTPFMGFTCTNCGPVSREKFAPDVRKRILRNSIFAVLASVLILVGVVAGYAMWEIHKEKSSAPTAASSSDNKFSVTIPKNYGPVKTSSSTEETPSGTIHQEDFSTMKLDGYNLLKVTRYTFPAPALGNVSETNLIRTICSNYRESVFDATTEVLPYIFRDMPACSTRASELKPIGGGKTITVDGEIVVVFKRPQVVVFAGLSQRGGDRSDLEALMRSAIFH